LRRNPIVAQSELEILKGVIKMNLAARQKDISASLRDLYKRINTRRFWAYVYDDALALLGMYQDVFAQDVQPAELEAANTLLGELRDYSLGVKKPDTTGKAAPYEPPSASDGNDTRSSAMGTHTFESEAELQSFLADHLTTTTTPTRGFSDQSQAALLSSLAPLWSEPSDPTAPRTRASISALRWVIRDEDLKLLDAIISGITLSASAGFLLSAVVSPSAMSTAIINITVALMKLLYNAHQKGATLSKEDFALISLLKSKPDGLQEQEISSQLAAAGINCPPEELRRRLRSLLEVPTRSGKTALVWESAEHIWRSSGV
jgi:hypothetical protein